MKQLQVLKSILPPRCTTPTDQVYGSGLWLFTRDRSGIKVDLYVKAMLLYLELLGVASDDLKKVTQVGCQYQGAILK